MNPIYIGALSSIVTEILKLVPGLASNQLTKALVAILVTAVGTWLFGTDGLTLTSFAAALTAALVSYKAIIAPLAQTAGLSTQK